MLPSMLAGEQHHPCCVAYYDNVYIAIDSTFPTKRSAGVPRVRRQTDGAVIHDTDVLTSVVLIACDGKGDLPDFSEE